MKIDKKDILIDSLILIVPMLILILLMPILPESILIHRGLTGDTYIDKKFAFVLGVLPLLIYMEYKAKHTKN